MLEMLFSFYVLNIIFESSKRLWSVVVVREAVDAHTAHTKRKTSEKQLINHSIYNKKKYQHKSSMCQQILTIYLL